MSSTDLIALVLTGLVLFICWQVARVNKLVLKRPGWMDKLSRSRFDRWRSITAVVIQTPALGLGVWRAARSGHWEWLTILMAVLFALTTALTVVFEVLISWRVAQQRGIRIRSEK